MRSSNIIMFSLTFPQYFPRPMHQAARVSETFRSLCKIVCRIFHAMAMAIQYADILASITIRHWCWFPSSLEAEKLVIFTRNIASFEMLKKCFKTVVHPIPKNIFNPIGRQQGLRMTQDHFIGPLAAFAWGCPWHSCRSMCLQMIKMRRRFWQQLNF